MPSSTRPSQSVLDARLLCAANEGDHQAAAEALALGANPDADDGFATALILAARFGSVECARPLAPLCDLSRKDHLDMTALMWFAMGDSPEGCALLANPATLADASPARQGRGALGIAAEAGAARALRALLAHGDPSLLDDDGRDALICAAGHGRLECVELLLALCDLDLRDHSGRGAADAAMAHPQTFALIQSFRLSLDERAALAGQVDEDPPRQNAKDLNPGLLARSLLGLATPNSESPATLAKAQIKAQRLWPRTRRTT